MSYRVAMRLLSILAFVSLSGCSYWQYVYGFDVTDPGAVNYKDFRRPDVLEDADVKLEVRADPTEFRAVALDVTNHTNDVLGINWGGIVLVGPDHVETALAPQSSLGPVQPGAKVQAVLGPFALPSVGGEARAYDGAKFELVIPTVVRGAPHEYRVHLRATLKHVS